MRTFRTGRPRVVAAFGLAAAVTVPSPAGAGGRTFDEDVAFLRKHVEVLVLQDAAGGRVAVVPAWQGRVMTSATGGSTARGFGWINDELVASGQLRPHINAFGGEEIVDGYMRDGVFTIDRVYTRLVFRIDRKVAEADRLAR